MKKSKIQNNNLLYIIALIGLFIGIVLCVYFVYVVFSYKYQTSNEWIYNSVLKQIKNNFGDFLTGTVGVLFTLTTTLFLFITFREQRKQFDLSNQDQDQSRFETTYFNLLSMLDDVRNNVNQDISLKLLSSESKSIYDYYNLLEKYYNEYPTKSNKPEFNNIMSELKNSSINSFVEMAEGSIQDFFDSFIKENKCNIGYYFRYIYNTIKFVIDERGQYNDVSRYLNILQAQLSNEELALIFYDALSSYGRDKNGIKRFKEILNTYQVLENIDESYLLNRNHYVFYSGINFKFLNRTELESIKNKETYNE